MVRISSKLGIIVLALLLLVIPALVACGGGDDDDDVVTGGGDDVTVAPTNDNDSDGILNDADNCPDDKNSDQADSDGDGEGDACDDCDDPDGDGACVGADNCPDDANADQADSDGDGTGDACDVCPNDETNDFDGDGVCGDVDNCSSDANPDQADADGDGVGDVCDTCPNDATGDIDGDGLCDSDDTCPNDPDNDIDADTICGDVDNCPNTANTDQADEDGDGIGDLCKDDNDGDGVPNADDNCPADPNSDQADADGDGFGDVCDTPACVGASWQYEVTYISDDPQRPEENTIALTANVTGKEEIDGVETYLIETETDTVGKRFYYHADMSMTVPTDLSAPTVYRDATHKGIIKETFPLFANVMGGIDLAVDRMYVDYEGAPEELSVGATWTYRTIIDLPTFAVHIENDWSVEVVGEEEITVPMGTYNCYKVEKTKDDGCINTEWWAVDEGFCTPVKHTYSCIFVGEETQVLTSYTAP